MTDDNPSQPHSAKQVADQAADKWKAVEPEVTTAKQLYENSQSLNQNSSPNRDIYMHNTSMEKHYANMMAVHDGLPKDNPVGLMALLEAQISKAMNDVQIAQTEFKKLSETLQFHLDIDKDHYEDLTEGLQETNALIDQLQHELDDYVSDSVFPAYLITPSADAYDEEAAKAFFEHFLENYEGEEGYFELRKVIMLQENLRQAYSDRKGWLDWDVQKDKYDVNNKAVKKWSGLYKEAQANLAKRHAHFLFLLSQRTGAIDKVDPAKIRAEGRIRVQSGQEEKAFNDAAIMLEGIGQQTKRIEEEIEAAQTAAQETILDAERFEREIVLKTAQSNAALEKALRDPTLDIAYRRSVKEQVKRQNTPKDKDNYDRSLRLFGTRWNDIAKVQKEATINRNKKEHVRNNFALRGGILLKSDEVQVIPIQRDDENGNTLLCMLPEYDNAIVTLAINTNSKYKWIIKTVLNQYPEWTEVVENETPGVPLNVTNNSKETPENCLNYHALVWQRIEPVVKERLAQANVTDMMGITMNDPATSAVWD